MANWYFDKEGVHKKQNLENTRYEMSEVEFTNMMSELHNSEDSLIIDWDNDIKKPFIKNLTKDFEHKKHLVRKKRIVECFSVINRGPLWYDTLTESQKQELKIWYKQWLDVTINLSEPVKPKWLK
jgi:hypothetical protein